MKTKSFSFRSAATTAVITSLLLFGPWSSLAASPSELLEQGIYSEETKGDIDAALKLYQQAVTETKAGQNVGAQAQYRLGVCLYKKKDYAAASAAFDKLIRDFPDQKELVAQARTYLAGTVVLLPAPWTDGEELRLDLKFAGGKKLGFAHYSAQSGRVDGRNIWRLKSHIFAIVEQFSRVEVDADSFKPLHSRWKHTLIGDADATFTAGGVDLKLAGRDGVQHIDLKDVVYDNEEVVELMRRLPLTTNYSTTLPVFTGLGGGSTIRVRVSVSGIEQVEVPAGTFDCFKVDLELGLKQTFWYSTDAHRYPVKFEANGVTAELTDITRVATASFTWHDAAGFSLTAPPEWIFYPSTASDPKGKLLVLDPNATAIAEVRVQNLDTLKAEAKKSVRDWANQLIADKSEVSKITARPDSWQERKVDGQPALSVIADCSADKDPKVIYAVCAFDKGKAVHFSVEIPAADLESYRSGFDAIVDSFRMD